MLPTTGTADVLPNPAFNHRSGTLVLLGVLLILAVIVDQFRYRLLIGAN